MKDPDRSTVRCSALTFGRALVGAALSSLVSGCTPGQVAPSPYGCGDVTSGHCYAQFQPALGARDPASTQCTADPGSRIFGYRTSLSVDQGLAPGNGFVNEEMWLLSHTGPGWIEAGYHDDTVQGDVYFWAQNDNVTGTFTATYLDAVPPADVGSDLLVQIFNNGPDRTSSSSFTVSLDSATKHYSATATNQLWDASTTANSTFVAEVQVGEELAGTSGARSDDVFFQKNSWMDAVGAWRLQTVDVTPYTNDPPFGGWAQTPCSTAQANAPSGGAFVTYCCAPQTASAMKMKSRRLSASRSLPSVAAGSALPAGPVAGIRAVEPRLRQGRSTLPDAAVAEFARTHATPRIARIGGEAQVIDTDCSHTARQLAGRLPQRAASLGEERLVCYVELRGRFAISAPPRRNGRRQEALQFDRSFEVFDARTGNLLLEGAGPGD